MAKMKSINSKAITQFRAALLAWHQKMDIQIQQSAARLGISQTLMSRLIHGTTGISMAQAEAIANEMGKDLVDMLEEGRILLGQEKAEQEQTSHYTEDQLKAITAFKVVLLHGGEGAEMIAKNAIELAKKKQAEAEDPTRRQGLKSAS